jgi:hypothetical protein
MATPYDLLYRHIYAKVSSRLTHKDQRWLSLKCGKELLENEDVNVEAAIEEVKRHHAEWKNDTSRLTAFVHENAPQLFTMLVYKRQEKLLDQFCDKGIGDAMFPVKLVQDDDQDDISIECTQENSPRKLELSPQINFDEALNLFDYSQWLFFVPELRWASFDSPPVDSECKLPFLKRDKISHTEFSIVYQGVIHRDHVAFDSDGIVSTQAVAFTCCQTTGLIT